MPDVVIAPVLFTVTAPALAIAWMPNALSPTVATDPLLISTSPGASGPPIACALIPARRPSPVVTIVPLLIVADRLLTSIATPKSSPTGCPRV